MAIFSLSFALCFLLLHVTGVFGVQYDVTVITDPPSGPFMIGNRISFTCHVYPMPPEPVTYSWHAMRNADGPTTLSGQNTTHYTPSYRDLYFSWFFCKVFSNESLIGVGRRLVEIHGFVFSVKPLTRTFILGSTIELQVNISTNYRASHIGTLIWYHNETEILTRSSGRVSVLNNGRRIIIRDTTHADAGNYEVKIASLDYDDSVCDSLWLPLLRNHAALAPVTFTLKLMNEPPSSQYWADEHPSMENLPVQYYPLANDNSTTLLTVSHDTNLSSSWTFNLLAGVLNYVHSALIVNGSRLASDASKFNLSQITMESGILTQVINFQYNLSDEGFYVHSFYLSDPYYLYRVHKSRRCEDYYDYADIYLRLYRISFVTFPFVLTTYRPPTQVNISSLYFAESGLTLLVCTATGGVPDSHNITLFHSNHGQKLATSMGNELQSNIDFYNLFWEVTCIVESLYGTKQVSLHLYKKASFQLLLAENKKMECYSIQLKVNRSAFYEDIRSLFKTICDCSVDLEQVRADCSMTGNTLLSGTVIYSNANSEGNITASTLIDMLQVWLLASTDPVLTLQNQPFKLIPQCPVRLTLATVDACRNLKIANLGVNESAVIGGSFIGGVLTGVLACLVTLCIGLCVLKLKADISIRKAGSTSETPQTTLTKEEEMVMGTNQAYETVEIHYDHSPSRNRPQASDSQENATGEPVYENHQHL